MSTMIKGVKLIRVKIEEINLIDFIEYLKVRILNVKEYEI